MISTYAAKSRLLKILAREFECFPCCVSLSSRLSDTSSTAVANLDAVLSALTISYDESRFTTLVDAYTLLARQPGQVMEKVIQYTQTNLVGSLRKILGAAGDPEAEEKNIEEVCKERVTSATQLANVLALFSSIVWQILKSFVNIQEFYRKSESAVRDLAYNKLSTAKEDIWQTVQVKFPQHIINKYFHFYQFIFRLIAIYLSRLKHWRIRTIRLYCQF